MPAPTTPHLRHSRLRELSISLAGSGGLLAGCAAIVTGVRSGVTGTPVGGPIGELLDAWSRHADTVTLYALRAAGLNGQAPRGGGAFRTLVSQLTNNAEWLILTAIGLFLTAAAGALIFGARQAPDWLFKAGVGLLLLLVGVPAVLA